MSKLQFFLSYYRINRAVGKGVRESLATAWMQINEPEPF